MGERRERPDVQVRESLTIAKQASVGFEDAWPRATRGEVCDEYRSRRNDDGSAWPPSQPGEPTNLRASTGLSRCAGCRYLEGRTCQLFGAAVYPGVLWPHRTEERQEWQKAITESEAEWRAAFEDTETAYALAYAKAQNAQAADDAVDRTVIVGGTLAA